METMTHDEWQKARVEAATPTEDTRLKPCPFCGGPAVNVAAEYIQCGAPYNMFGQCPGLSVRASIEQWNTRTQSEPERWAEENPVAWEALQNNKGWVKTKGDDGFLRIINKPFKRDGETK